jgi:phospholipid/cholesterol/gamma-HCH transport system substrate-binding protein
MHNKIPELSDSLKHNAGVVATAIDRDFNRIATEIEKGVGPLREAMQKINDGKGVLGQLLTDEQTSDDIRTAISGIRSYFDKIDKMKIVFDMHSESMNGPIEARPLMHENKTYANIRLHTSEDYFYVVGLVGSRNGQVRRFDEIRNWYDDSYHELIPGDLILDDNKKLHYARYRKFKTRSLDTLLFNVQLGRIFGNFCFRFGLFDSTGGVGVDIDIPFGVADLRWVTTLEAFDFNGVNRFYEDTREDNTPHLKWFNRMFVTKNIYCTFGADDFISRFNKNAFFGIGLRFVDDDVKFVLSRITVLAPS